MPSAVVSPFSSCFLGIKNGGRPFFFLERPERVYGGTFFSGTYDNGARKKASDESAVPSWRSIIADSCREFVCVFRTYPSSTSRCGRTLSRPSCNDHSRSGRNANPLRQWRPAGQCTSRFTEPRGISISFRITKNINYDIAFLI